MLDIYGSGQIWMISKSFGGFYVGINGCISKELCTSCFILEMNSITVFYVKHGACHAGPASVGAHRGYLGPTLSEEL